MTIVLLAVISALLILLVSFVRVAMTGEPFLHAFYWSTASALHREPGPEPDSAPLYTLSLVWILLSETYWAAVIGAAVTWIGEFFEK